MGHSVSLSHDLGPDGRDGGASSVVCRTAQRTLDTYPAFISATAVLNIMVVFLYWRLYFIDPALVNGDNTPCVVSGILPTPDRTCDHFDRGAVYFPRL